MNAGLPPIDFWFDFSSPYAYIASEWIEALAARHRRTVRWHAILLGVTFQAAELKSPVSHPIKRDYALRDFERSAPSRGQYQRFVEVKARQWTPPFEFYPNTAPQSGVPEDPVTGSLHAELVPYWAERLGKSALHSMRAPTSQRSRGKTSSTSSARSSKKSSPRAAAR